MKELPDFNINIYQAINYIFESDLAVVAFKNPPFINFVNIVRRTIETIDRLSENCNMPEFTNHGLRHICSLVKRTSEWAITDGWIENINCKEAGYLLMALIVHDLGMLSQETSDLSSDVALEYKRGIGDLATWVRKTHVLRLSKLLHRIFYEFENEDIEVKNHIEAIAQMAASHNYWPWDKEYDIDEKLTKFIGIENDRIYGLNAVIAVVDLLDEDSNRCDSEVLIKHKRGNKINIAHWYRHALTAKVNPIKNHKVKISLRAIDGMDESFEDVFKVIRNQFRIVLVYKKYLSIINAQIDELEFEPTNEMPKIDKEVKELDVWNEKVELKYSMKELLMLTFIPETRGERCDSKLYNELVKLNLEQVKPLEETGLTDNNQLLFDDEKLLYKISYMKLENYDEIFSYYKEQVEHSFLLGEVGKVKNICCMILEYLECSNIDRTYWVFVYLIYLLDSEQDYRLISEKINFSGRYGVLLQLVIALLNNDEKECQICWNKLLTINLMKFNKDSETRLLFSILIEYSYQFFYKTTDKYIQELMNKIKENEFLYSYLVKVQTRLSIQFRLITGEDINVDILDKFNIEKEERILCEIWKNFFVSDAEKLDASLRKVSKLITPESKYYKSYMGLFIATEHIRDLSIKESSIKKEDIYTKHYRFIRLEMENQYNVLEQRREKNIEKFLNDELYDHKQIERLIVSGQMEAMRNWDILNFISFRSLYARYYEKLGEKCYDSGKNSSYICRAIICWIQSLKTYDEKKDKKKLIGIIEVNEKNNIEELYRLIFHNIAMVYWDNASTWLKALGDLMPKELVDDWVRWIYKYNSIIRSHMSIIRLADLDFIKTIIEEYKFNDEQMNILEPILVGICKKDYYWSIELELCKSIMMTLSIEKCKEIIEQLTIATEERPGYSSIYINTMLKLAHERFEISEYIKEMMQKRYNLTENEKYLEYQKLIGVKCIENLEMPDIFKINTEVKHILEEYEVELSKGHHNVSNIKNIAEIVSNKNLSICDEKSICCLLEEIKRFTHNNASRLYQLDYNIIFSILVSISNGGSDETRKAILSIGFEIYGEFLTNEKFFSNQKKSLKRSIIDQRDMKEIGFLYMFSSLIDYSDNKQLNNTMEWCIDIAEHIKEDSMHFYVYIFSYSYIFRNDYLKNISYRGLELLAIIIKFKSETKKDYLYYVLLGIQEFIHNIKHSEKNSFDKIKENKTYVKWLKRILNFGSKSIYYENRKKVFKIIEEINDNKLFEKVCEILKEDARMSIAKYFE
ncbi:HD domain-containing protein [Clostridium diolis]|uniref:HD-CE domain-containing protein n=1 Tax=Clostridium diolis TaxID=223919 RepID=A0AAV3VY71_9CLOT|nr:hypothetical protein [Clostridium diolis]QES71972.1 hypothetical protein F3K33_03785 [Clostridium diolis]GEA30902.1 hypothetical protein CDIOL_18250 [Clostridium diolis]